MLQIIAEVAAVVWNLSASGFSCPSVSLLLTLLLPPILDAGDMAQILRGGQVLDLISGVS